MAANDTKTKDREAIYQAEVNSTFEPWLVDKAFVPLLERLPHSLAPNSISLIGHVICWGAGFCAWASTYLPPLYKALALVGTGVLMFMATAADCLDGMQARRTGRTSKLGELLDHWLDAIHVPIVSASIVLALGLDPWIVVAVHVTNAAIYNAQLVLYHHSGRFVHTPTSGVDAQFGTSVGFIAAAIYLGVFGPIWWLNIGLGVAATLIQLKLNFFYWRRMSLAQALPHVLFYLFCAAFAALYILGMMSTLVFALSIIFLSFRITGTFVLQTVLKRPYDGWDAGIIFWLLAIPAGHFFLGPVVVQGYRVDQLVPHLAILYMAGRNLIDLARNFEELAPASHDVAHP